MCVVNVNVSVHQCLLFFLLEERYEDGGKQLSCTHLDQIQSFHDWRCKTIIWKHLLTTSSWTSSNMHLTLSNVWVKEVATVCNLLSAYIPITRTERLPCPLLSHLYRHWSPLPYNYIAQKQIHSTAKAFFYHCTALSFVTIVDKIYKAANEC